MVVDELPNNNYVVQVDASFVPWTNVTTATLLIQVLKNSY